MDFEVARSRASVKDHRRCAWLAEDTT